MHVLSIATRIYGISTDKHDEKTKFKLKKGVKKHIVEINKLK